jgi:hypothetical protein
MWTFGAWLFVFATNLAVPLLFSSSVTQAHGSLGMVFAILALLTLGGFLCTYHRELSRALLIGGVLIAMTQLIPIPQILAGWIGLAIGNALGLAEFSRGDQPARLTSEFGGFVVTLITGGILITAAACIGLTLRWLASRFRTPR